MPELSFFDQPRFVSNDWRIFLKRVFNIWSSSSLRQSKQHISRFYLPTWSKDKKEKSICLIPCKPLSPMQIGKVTKRTRLRSQDCFYSFLSVTLIEKKIENETVTSTLGQLAQPIRLYTTTSPNSFPFRFLLRFEFCVSD